MRLVDLLPLPSLRTQRVIAALVILTQGGIAVTGAIVRVTASGLGCPTWPQCFPAASLPVAVAEVPRHPPGRRVRQPDDHLRRGHHRGAGRARGDPGTPAPEVLVYAWLMPLSTVVQAVIGGITVRTGLLWWTVAIHLLASMTMVWLSVLLYVKVGEPDGTWPEPFTPGWPSRCAP